MNKSESIKNIAVALAKFNGEVSKISKDAKNPFFKSDYVTLDALIEATRPILQAHGLSIMQFPLTKEDAIGIQTMIIHESGEYIESEPLYMKPQKVNDPQNAGSIISYMRRYSYQSILNLNTGEDDDGNIATHGNKKPPKKEFSPDNTNIPNQDSKPVETNTGLRKQVLSDAQVKRLYTLGTKCGYSSDKVKEQVLGRFSTEPKLLTKKEYDNVCNGYLAKAEAMEEQPKKTPHKVDYKVMDNIAKKYTSPQKAVDDAIKNFDSDHEMNAMDDYLAREGW